MDLNMLALTAAQEVTTVGGRLEQAALSLVLIAVVAVVLVVNWRGRNR